jgi:hypothetical protein
MENVMNQSKTERRETVMTTNNACDYVLLVDANDEDRVIGAWMADEDVITNYLRDGSDAQNWEASWPDVNRISDYGAECGRNGVITDEHRRDYWVRESA